MRSRLSHVKSALALAGCLVVLVACSSPAASETAVVSRVGDGDTLALESGERVRLVQIDAPELGEGECYAAEATDELRRLLAPGTEVVLEREPETDDEDRFGRLLRYVRSPDGLNVNLELVRRGAAEPYFFGGVEGAYADELRAARDEARAARRGLWGTC